MLAHGCSLLCGSVRPLEGWPRDQPAGMARSRFPGAAWVESKPPEYSRRPSRRAGRHSNDAKETVMGIALTMQEYLEDNHVPYDVARHGKTGSSAMTAEASHVPGGGLAKGVVLRWDGSYLLAVVPASRHVDLEKVGALVGERVELASEDEASALFPDCDTGAVPVLGAPYRIACVVDDRLERRDEVWFEGGDHRTLVHVSGDGFGRLMYGIPHGRISD
jgi:Ala-tRNA(Pro) deacylase